MSGKKSKQARWQIANKRTSSRAGWRFCPPPAYKPAHKKTSDCQGCERVVEARRFVVETLIACRCSFQRQPSPPGTSWPVLNVGLPGCLFGFCFVCLVSMPAWYLFLFSSLIWTHIFSENTCESFPKHITLLTKSVGQFFHSPKRKKKKEATGDLDASSQALYSHAAPQKEFLCCVK